MSSTFKKTTYLPSQPVLNFSQTYLPIPLVELISGRPHIKYSNIRIHGHIRIFKYSNPRIFEIFDSNGSNFIIPNLQQNYQNLIYCHLYSNVYYLIMCQFHDNGIRYVSKREICIIYTDWFIKSGVSSAIYITHV